MKAGYKMNKTITIVIVVLLFEIIVAYFTVWIVGSYITYRRLNKVVDEFIDDVDMNIEEKREILSSFGLTAIKMGNSCFPIFKSKFYDIHIKIVKATHI